MKIKSLIRIFWWYLYRHWSVFLLCRLASADLDLAIKIEPRIVAAYWQRHLIRLLHHQKHEALDDLNALLKIDPKCVHAYRWKAMFVMNS